METMVNAASGAGRGSRKAVRTCASCGGEDEPAGLVRFVRTDDGDVYPDLKGSLPGRGAWVHPRPDCLAKLATALAKSFKARVNTTSDEARQLLGEAAVVRIWQLLGAAKRQRLVAEGGTLVEEAWDAGQAKIVLLARDARAAAESRAVREAVPRGLVRVFSNKDALGRLFGRPELGVLAVLDERLAQALFEAIALALLAPESNSAAHGPGNIGFSEVE